MPPLNKATHPRLDNANLDHENNNNSNIEKVINTKVGKVSLLPVIGGHQSQGSTLSPIYTDRTEPDGLGGSSALVAPSKGLGLIICSSLGQRWQSLLFELKIQRKASYCQPRDQLHQIVSEDPLKLSR